MPELFLQKSIQLIKKMTNNMTATTNKITVSNISNLTVNQLTNNAERDEESNEEKSINEIKVTTTAEEGSSAQSLLSAAVATMQAKDTGISAKRSSTPTLATISSNTDKSPVYDSVEYVNPMLTDDDDDNNFESNDNNNEKNGDNDYAENYAQGDIGDNDDCTIIAFDTEKRAVLQGNENNEVIEEVTDSDLMALNDRSTYKKTSLVNSNQQKQQQEHMMQSNTFYNIHNL